MRRRKLLVVEDQPALATGLRALLERRGYLVRVAENGELGLRTALEWLPDVVLMDLSMPVMNGYEATEALRADDRTRWIPVMATTALDRPEEVLRALVCGFNRYLRKPYRETEVVEQVEELIALAERQRRLTALAPQEERVEVGQILAELLATIQQRLPCDLFALAQGGEAPSLLITAELEQFGAELVAQVEGLAWGEGADGPLPEPTLVVVEGEAAGSQGRLESAVVVPLQIARDTAGTFVLGSFTEQSYGEAELQLVRELAVAVADVLRFGAVVTGPEPDVDELAGELQLLLVMEGEDGQSYAEAVETALPGVRVTVAGSAEEMARDHGEVHLALVEQPLYDAFEAIQLRRSRRGHRSVAALQLEPGQLTQSEERLAAFLLMSVMIGVSDSGATGCLHLQRRGGAPVGLVVFHQGRLAWASSAISSAHLLDVLAEVTGIEGAALKDVAKRSVVEASGFFRRLEIEGQASAEQCAEALKTYLTVVVGDLLRQKQLSLFWSRQVRVGPGDLTFDAAEIMMSSFGA